VLLVGVGRPAAAVTPAGPGSRSAWLDVYRDFIQLQSVPQPVLDLVGNQVALVTLELPSTAMVSSAKRRSRHGAI
jgi:hypothetical protein